MIVRRLGPISDVLHIGPTEYNATQSELAVKARRYRVPESSTVKEVNQEKKVESTDKTRGKRTPGKDGTILSVIG